MEERVITKVKQINYLPIVITIVILAVLVFVFIALPMTRTAHNFYGLSPAASLNFA